MITDNDKNILGRNDLVLLRERRLREFLTDWFTIHQNSTKIVIEENVSTSKKLIHCIQVSVTFPLNWKDLDLDTLIDYVIQQVFEKNVDIPWSEDICDFEYSEVILFNFSDYSSLYPTALISQL